MPAPTPVPSTSASRVRLLATIAIVSGVVLAICGVVAFAVDEPAARWASRSLRDTGIGGLAEFLTHFGESTWVFIAAAAAILVGLLGRRPRLAGIGVVFTAATAVSGVLVNLLKVGFGRARPKLLDEQGAVAFSPFSVGYDWNSFPSGHATTALTIAGVAWVVWPRWRWIWISVGVAVASTRWVIGAHYPADLVAGAVLGLACGLVVARTSGLWWPSGWDRCVPPCGR